MTRFWFAAALIVAAAACGGEPPVHREVAPTPRKMSVWLEEGGLDAAAAEQLRRVGVDQVVARRGSIDLRGRAPVLRIGRAAPVDGPLPLAAALTVTGARPDLDRSDAAAVWQALEPELGGLPAELVLDLPVLSRGLPDFLVALREISGVAVVPLLSFTQLAEETGRDLAAAAGSCVVPAFGTEDVGLRGVDELGALPLDEKLAPLAATAVRVRTAISLEPRTQPPVAGFADGLEGLTEPEVALVSTSSPLDRTFIFQRATTWNGRPWDAGDTLAVRWMDGARLRAAFRDSHRLVMPELGGWDLVPLPAEDQRLGLSRETLIRLLAGAGPEPAVRVDVDRQGRWLRVALENPSVFGSAVSNHGNWIEVSVEEAWVKASDSGSFDRLGRGTVRGDDWQQRDFERVNSVRFFEVYLAPGEELRSGRVELPSTGSEARIRWHLTLSDGSAVTGESTR